MSENYQRSCMSQSEGANKQVCNDLGTVESIASGPSSLTYGSDEEEYLKATWNRLGVGQDGLLSLEDLSKVCEAIGLEKDAIQEIKHLFGRLDVDEDGMITFQEFLHIFQSTGSASNNQSQIFDDSFSQESRAMSSVCIASISSRLPGALTEFGIFSTLDPENTGSVSVTRLVEVWFGLGVSDGSRVLRELCLPHRPGDKVSLQDLAAALEEECRPPAQEDSVPMITRQAAFLLLLYEVKGIRLILESCRGERDKFRWDLNEANHRISLVTQELDDHSTHMEASSNQKISSLERQYKEQIRELQETLKREREMARDEACSENQKMQSLNSYLQEEESRLKSTIIARDNEIRKLENDNMDMNDKMKETEYQLQLMEKQIFELKLLENKVAEFECATPREEEFKALAQKMEMLVSENNNLRDNNDELHAQIDSLSCKASLQKQEDRSLDGSIIGDYVDHSSGNLIGGLKRRGEPPLSDSEDQGGGERGSKIMKKSADFPEKHLSVHYFDTGVYDESFDASLTSQGLERISYRKLSFSPEEMSSLSPMPFRLLAPNTPQPLSLPLPRASGCTKSAEVGFDKPDLSACSEEGRRGSSPDGFLLGSVPLCSTPQKPKSRCQWCIKVMAALKTFEKILGTNRNLQLEDIHSSEPDRSEDMNGSLMKTNILPDDLHDNFKNYEEMEASIEKLKKNALFLAEQQNQILEENRKMNGQLSKNTGEHEQILYEQCHNLTEKLKRKRVALSSLTGYISSDSLYDPVCNRDGITTITEEDETDDFNDTDQESSDSDQDDTDSNELQWEKNSPLALLRQEIDILERELGLYEEEMGRDKDQLEKQQAIAEERCSKFEKDIEILKSDYSSSEDYWSLKIKEEQEYYEEERKLYDEKFSELVHKIGEYEALSKVGTPSEILISANSDNSDDFDRLTPIEENVIWEKQITELEEEVKVLQNQNEYLFQECETMESSCKITLLEDQSKHTQEISGLLQENETLKSRLHSAERQADYAKEELQNIKDHNTPVSSGYVQSVVSGIEKGSVQRRASDISSRSSSSKIQKNNDESLCGPMNIQLEQANRKMSKLENALKMHQKVSCEIMTKTQERHQSEIEAHQTMNASAQQALTTCLAKCKDQTKRAFRCDVLVRDLYVENAQLMKALQITEQRQKEAEKKVRELQIDHAFSSI